MPGKALYIFATILLAMSVPARAATVSVLLSDSHGGAAVDAVVTLSPVGTAVKTAHAPDESVIDQRNQMFMPLVAVVRRGGRVVFANNDSTMHQVYSFSAIKPFEAEIEKGQRSRPVVFDKAGIAVIGCNIHDNMIAYVFVSDAPFAVTTDTKGEATIVDVAPGQYRAEIWHPRLGQATIAVDLTVTGTGASITRSLPLATDKMSGMHRTHQQSY